jgi:hypothetical protein
MEQTNGDKGLLTEKSAVEKRANLSKAKQAKFAKLYKVEPSYIELVVEG